MYTTKSISLLAAAIALAGTATPAFAWHGHVTRVEGPFGRGYVHSRSVSRAPGSVSANRNTQTNGGYGMATNRQANWGNGTYNGSATHTLNNGESFGRTTSLTRNGDGTASYTTTHEGVNGQTSTVSGTLGHTPQ
jgi:hypothetical protein